MCILCTYGFRTINYQVAYKLTCARVFDVFDTFDPHRGSRMYRHHWVPRPFWNCAPPPLWSSRIARVGCQRSGCRWNRKQPFPKSVPRSRCWQHSPFLPWSRHRRSACSSETIHCPSCPVHVHRHFLLQPVRSPLLDRLPLWILRCEREILEILSTV